MFPYVRILCLFRSTFPNTFFGFPLSLLFFPVSGCFVVIWGCHIWDKTWNTLHDWILCSGYLGLLCFQIKMFLLPLCEKQTLLMFWWYCIKYLSILVIWPFKHFQCNHGMSFHLLGYLHFLSLVLSNFHFSGLFHFGFIARMNTYILSYYEWNFSSFLMSSWLVYRQTTLFCMLFFAMVHSWICFSFKKLKNFCWSL